MYTVIWVDVREVRRGWINAEDLGIRVSIRDSRRQLRELELDLPHVKILRTCSELRTVDAPLGAFQGLVGARFDSSLPFASKSMAST